VTTKTAITAAITAAISAALMMAEQASIDSPKFWLARQNPDSGDEGGSDESPCGDDQGGVIMG